MSSNLSQYSPRADLLQHKNRISNIRSGGRSTAHPIAGETAPIQRGGHKSHIRTLIGDSLGMQKDPAECPAFPSRGGAIRLGGATATVSSIGKVIPVERSRHYPWLWSL
jgi:hypothetical protein